MNEFYGNHHKQFNIVTVSFSEYAVSTYSYVAHKKLSVNKGQCVVVPCGELLDGVTTFGNLKLALVVNVEPYRLLEYPLKHIYAVADSRIYDKIQSLKP